MAEDIKDVSKHCYLALSFAPTDHIWGLPTGNPGGQNFHPAIHSGQEPINNIRINR